MMMIVDISRTKHVHLSGERTEQSHARLLWPSRSTQNFTHDAHACVACVCVLGPVYSQCRLIVVGRSSSYSGRRPCFRVSCRRMDPDAVHDIGSVDELVATLESFLASGSVIGVQRSLVERTLRFIKPVAGELDGEGDDVELADAAADAEAAVEAEDEQPSSPKKRSRSTPAGKTHARAVTEASPADTGAMERKHKKDKKAKEGKSATREGKSAKKHKRVKDKLDRKNVF